MEFRIRKAKAKLNPYKPRELKPYELMTEAEFNSRPDGTFMVDSELFTNYFLIAFRCVQTKKVITFEITPDNRFNPFVLSHVMHARTTIGFNSIAYDLPMIWLAYANQDIVNLRVLSDDLIFGFERYKNYQKEYGFQIFPTPHIDLIEVCPLRGSLKTYGARLHSPRIQDLPFPPTTTLTREQANIVKHYCINDLDNTELIADNLTEQLELRYNLGIEYRADLLSKSDPQVAETVISTELQRMTGKRPKRPTISAHARHLYKIPPYIRYQSPVLQNALEVIRNAEFEVLESGRLVMPQSVRELRFQIGKATYQMGIGGLHSCEKGVGYKANETHTIKDTDVSSYYPAVILNQQLYPKHLGMDFLTVYRQIFERRLKAKAEKNYAVSEGLKIAINGVFGKLGSPYSIVYAPDLMVQTTITGQLAILMQIEQCEAIGIQVISANTDGFVVYCPRAMIDQFKQIVTAWEKETGFITEETEYTGYYARDVNNYLAFKADGSVKGKGAYANPWNDPKLAIFRFHKNPKVTICTRACTQLISKGIPIEQTIKECKDVREFVVVQNVPSGAHQNGEYLGKVVRWYYVKGYRTINKLEGNVLVPESEGAKPLMDLPQELPPDIDYDWYVRRTVRMLEDIGFYQRTKYLF